MISIDKIFFDINDDKLILYNNINKNDKSIIKVVEWNKHHQYTNNFTFLDKWIEPYTDKEVEVLIKYTKDISKMFDYIKSNIFCQIFNYKMYVQNKDNSIEDNVLYFNIFVREVVKSTFATKESIEDIFYPKTKKEEKAIFNIVNDVIAILSENNNVLKINYENILLKFRNINTYPYETINVWQLSYNQPFEGVKLEIIRPSLDGEYDKEYDTYLTIGDVKSGGGKFYRSELSRERFKKQSNIFNKFIFNQVADVYVLFNRLFFHNIDSFVKDNLDRVDDLNDDLEVPFVYKDLKEYMLPLFDMNIGSSILNSIVENVDYVTAEEVKKIISAFDKYYFRVSKEGLDFYKSYMIEESERLKSQTKIEEPKKEEMFSEQDLNTKKDILKSAKMYFSIKRGEQKGYDANLFKSSAVNKLKTLSKNGKDELVKDILDTISKMGVMFTSNHSVWKLVKSNDVVDNKKIEIAFELGQKSFLNGGSSIPAQSKELQSLFEGREIGKTPKGEPSTLDISQSYINGYESQKKIDKLKKEKDITFSLDVDSKGYVKFSESKVDNVITKDDGYSEFDLLFPFKEVMIEGKEYSSPLKREFKKVAKLSLSHNLFLDSEWEDNIIILEGYLDSDEVQKTINEIDKFENIFKFWLRRLKTSIAKDEKIDVYLNSNDSEIWEFSYIYLKSWVENQIFLTSNKKLFIKQDVNKGILDEYDFRDIINILFFIRNINDSNSFTNMMSNKIHDEIENIVKDYRNRNNIELEEEEEKEEVTLNISERIWKEDGILLYNIGFSNEVAEFELYRNSFKLNKYPKSSTKLETIKDAFNKVLEEIKVETDNLINTYESKLAYSKNDKKIFKQVVYDLLLQDLDKFIKHRLNSKIEGFGFSKEVDYQIRLLLYKAVRLNEGTQEMILDYVSNQINGNFVKEIEKDENMDKIEFSYLREIRDSYNDWILDNKELTEEIINGSNSPSQEFLIDICSRVKSLEPIIEGKILFGKYKEQGLTLAEIYKTNPSYYTDWMREKIKGKNFVKAVSLIDKVFEYELFDCLNIEVREIKVNKVTKSTFNDKLLKIMPYSQYKSMIGSEELYDTVKELNDRVDAIPDLYSQEHKRNDAIAYLRIFSLSGNIEFYITEADFLKNEIVFSYCISYANYGEGESGYTALDDLKNNSLNIDFSFEPKTLTECQADYDLLNKQESTSYEEEEDDEEVSVIASESFIDIDTGNEIDKDLISKIETKKDYYEKYDFFKGYNHIYRNVYEQNKAIEELIDDYRNEYKEDALYTISNLDKNELRGFKDFINKYEGYGGLEKQGAEGKALLHEYYTPTLLIKKMWALAYKYGFTDGNVLEPSVGTGRFLQFCDFGSQSVTGYEISEYSAFICRVLYPNAKIVQHEKIGFEQHFYPKGGAYKSNFENNFDLVIGNPPYGEFFSLKKALETKKIGSVTQFEHYFILRGLDTLKSGGLLVYVVPPNLFNDGSYIKIKEKILEKADLLDAYMLPNSVFSRTEVNTCIMILKKK